MQPRTDARSKSNESMGLDASIMYYIALLYLPSVFFSKAKQRAADKAFLYPCIYNPAKVSVLL